MDSSAVPWMTDVESVDLDLLAHFLSLDGHLGDMALLVWVILPMDKCIFTLRPGGPALSSNTVCSKSCCCWGDR